ncbi:hypothetical protein, partial [Cochleicola gelatinilyticus]
MKRVILSALALMIGSFVFAQASQDAAAPDVEQADNLSGDTAANRVENTQSGTENYMLVRQEGTSSSVFIDQSGGGAGADEGNLVYVAQAGDVTGNTGLSGQANAADVRQSGTSNEGYVYQGGDRNAAGMQQSGDDQIAYIQQGVLNAEDNYAGVVQSGDTHSSWIFQGHDNNEALSLQSGSGHASKIDQNSAPDGSDGHNARVEQEGTSQMSYVEQDGSGSDADVFQTGNANYSDVQQDGGGANVFANNTADIDQDGTGNKSFVNQSNRNNSSVVDQLGDLNMSHVVQSGVGTNDGQVVQNGDGNYVRQTQTNGTSGSDANVALVNQGDRTNAQALSNNLPLFLATDAILSTQGGAVPADGSNENVAYQTQDGSGNNAESQQFSQSGAPFAGYSKQVQIGDNNTALVVQNAFDDTQLYNDNNSALQVQTGDNNSAGLIQIGNTQNAWMIQDGDDSVLAVQAGRENDLVSKQYEGTNFMEIGQQGLANDLFAAQRGGQSFIGDQSGFQNIMEVLQ